MLNIDQELATLNQGWTVEDGILRKAFEFKGFLKTMSFVNAVAWQANKIMHHPDMQVSFSCCVINITTHDEGNTLTEKDFELARCIDQLF